MIDRTTLICLGLFMTLDASESKKTLRANSQQKLEATNERLTKVFWIPLPVFRHFTRGDFVPKLVETIPKTATPHLNPNDPVFRTDELWLKTGVAIPNNAYIIYQPSSQRLIVYNTTSNIDILDMIFASIGGYPNFRMNYKLYKAEGQLTTPAQLSKQLRSAKLLDYTQAPTFYGSRITNHRSYKTPFELSYEAEFSSESSTEAKLTLHYGFAKNAEEEFELKKTFKVNFNKPHYQVCYYDKKENHTYFLVTTLHCTQPGPPKLKTR